MKGKVYIIAEIGINHNGSLENCYKLIDAAVDAGCNCVKFQFFRAKRLYPRTAGKLDWQDNNKRYSYDIYNAVKSFELPSLWIEKLMDYCRRQKIDFLSSVFDKEGVKFLIKKGMRMIKLPSSCVTNIPLIEYCAKYKIPIFLSTGGTTLGEIEEAVNTINRYHNNLSILHCSMKYPTELEECNLGVIETLKYAFPNNRIGYSDHTAEVSTAAVQAVYLGAKVIEKHITLNKNMLGPDHFFALEPTELRQMVSDIRKAEKVSRIQINQKIYGTSERKVFDHERYLREFCFPCLFINRDIKKGERIYRRDVEILRPGKLKRGIEPKFIYLFYSKKIIASRDLKAWMPIFWGDFCYE
ncbi:MAG: hypothetical protein DRP84_08895 [Spirochaetes bacterium]|nr:MAG: hypothetical protein DRP84_08895 [Spirochaetota bacterium]